MANKCVKILVFIFNFLLFLTGVGLIVLAGHLKKDDWSNISDYSYWDLANVCIAAGVVIIVFSVLGCYGAIAESKCALLIFVIFLVIIFALEIGAGIAAYVWRGDVEDELKKQIMKRIPSKYYTDKGVAQSVDLVQTTWACCGVNNASDYERAASPNYVPKSCCKAASDNCKQEANFKASIQLRNKYNWDAGCFGSVKKFIMDHLVYVGITGIVFAVFQILGLIFSLVLLCTLGEHEEKA